MTKNLTLRQRNRVAQRSARERKTYAADFLLVDDEGKTIEVCDGFFAAILRRASLRAEGKSARIFIVDSSAIRRVLFPQGTTRGGSFRSAPRSEACDEWCHPAIHRVVFDVQPLGPGLGVPTGRCGVGMAP